VIGKRLFVLLACLFVVMIGFGITLPVLPFYVERLAQAEGVTPEAIVMHVTLLTAVYPMGQLVFAPIWGRWSDRTGRRRLLLMGMAGYVIAQILFGLASSLWLLYAARILGGILSSATLPVSAAYVADATTEGERGRGMAWLGTATSLGFVVGPALGGLLARRDLHVTARYGHVMIDGFSIPFFAAAGLGAVTLAAAIRWLPESLPAHARRSGSAEPDLRTLVRSLSPLLGLAFVAQFALAMFEATFALHAQAVLDYGPAEVGAVFVVCGLVMAIFQVGASGFLAGRVAELTQIGIGFALMGTSLAVLMMPRGMASVLALVGVLALGMAFISPNLAAVISTRGGSRRAGTALGAQNAANSLGQASGPLVGGALFIWQMNAPYMLSGGALVAIALVIGWAALAGRR
jgi:DHA1 family multidrug resistance protein-like MFS transporter